MQRIFVRSRFLRRFLLLISIMTITMAYYYAQRLWRTVDCACQQTKSTKRIKNHTERNSTIPPSNITTESSSVQRPVDMVNDFYPYVDFKLVYPHIEPINRTDDCYLMVVVNSGSVGDVYRARREAIRKTWGSKLSCEERDSKITARTRNLKWCLVFMLGKSSNETHNEQNKEEALKYNDMIIGDIQDNYLNNIVKLYMAQMWMTSKKTLKYILKTDDDVYVRVPRVLEYLADQGFPARYYGGGHYGRIIVDRRVTGKWAVSWRYFPEKYFPKFHPGAFILYSADLLSMLLRYPYTRKPFHTDDAYIGIAMRDRNIKFSIIHVFAITIMEDVVEIVKKRNDCDTIKFIGVAHNLNPETLNYLHNRIETLCYKNVTLKSCRAHE